MTKRERKTERRAYLFDGGEKLDLDGVGSKEGLIPNILLLLKVALTAKKK
jgi:hypothetical protein